MKDMEREQLEFLISQYVDGTLSAEESAALETKLASDAEARAMLEDYRKLDVALKSSAGVPELKWDRLAEHLSNQIAEEPEPITSYKIDWVRRTVRFAVAAIVIITCSIAIRMYLVEEPGPGDVAMIGGNSNISGPIAEAASGGAIVQITVGPSPEIASDPAAMQYAEGVVYRPARVVIAASSAAVDSEKAPH